MLEIVLLVHLAAAPIYCLYIWVNRAASLALNTHKIRCSEIEHDAVKSLCETTLTTFPSGQVLINDPSTSAVQLANSETGIIQDLPKDIF